MIIFLALIALVAKVIAQEDNQRNDNVEAMKIGFITQKLNLTSTEAKLFWPVFNDFTSEQKKIKAKMKENMLTFKAKNTPTDQDAGKFISEQLLLKQSELDLTKKYVTEFKKVLPEVKVALLLTLEQEFKQQLLQKLKERHDKTREPKGAIHDDFVR
jgi:hypothetical protein